MISKKYFFILMLFSNIVHAMEERENDNSKSNTWDILNQSILNEQNNKQRHFAEHTDLTRSAKPRSIQKKEKSWFGRMVNKVLNSKEECKQEESQKENTEDSLTKMPREILVYIGDLILLINKDEKNAIVDHLTFSAILAGDNRFRDEKEGRLDMRKFKEEYVDFCKIYVCPFFFARNLGIKLSDDARKRYKELAKTKELEKQNIAPEDLSQWLSDHGYTQQMIDKNLIQGDLLFELIKNKRKDSIIGILALLNIQDIEKVNCEKQCKISCPAKFKQNEYGHTDGKSYSVTTSSPLIWAVCHNQNEIVDILLNFGLDPNIGQWGGHSLPFAVFQRNKEIVEMLSKAGANPNAKFLGKFPVLALALYPEEDKEISNLLKDYGAKAGFFSKDAYRAHVLPPFIWHSGGSTTSGGGIHF